MFDKQPLNLWVQGVPFLSAPMKPELAIATARAIVASNGAFGNYFVYPYQGDELVFWFEPRAVPKIIWQSNGMPFDPNT